MFLDGRDLEKMNVDELDELEDSEDEAVLLEFRNKRMAELKEMACRSKFGSVQEITGHEYVNEVNKAGENIWVVLHLYAKGVPVCALINQFISELAVKFPTVKFIRSIAQTCIPNFPESNCPSIFIYHNGLVRKQIIGSAALRGSKLTIDELEYILGTTGAVNTDIIEDPRPVVKDKLFSDLAEHNDW